MSDYDYARTLATAQRLITRYGRLVSLQGVSAGPADANNPLAGPADAPAPISGVPAAFVSPGSGLGLSARVAAIFANCTQIALVAPISGTPDFSSMKFLIDADNSIWKITNIETLKPAEIVLLHFIGVSRP